MKLSDRELYLLLTLCLDKHVEEDDYNSTVTIIYVVKIY
jgi:hypothetical protein